MANEPPTKVQISGWVDPELKQRFEAVAEAEHRSVSSLVTVLVARCVEDFESGREP